MSETPDWRRLVDHVMSIPERIYEHWSGTDGWDNDTQFGKEYGENLVSWCAIFDWDMYYDVGLDAVVPKTDNVTAFSNWAQAHGQWSVYPSVGAWVNLSAGGHTEIVVGFDADTVYTKGGNSVKAGSTDAGQGNGVWSHATARRSPRVVGYFAPRFPDGVCPPTADPHDPRGGTAVTSWRWTGAVTPTPEDDMTPAEHQMLVDLTAAMNKLTAALLPYMGWDYANVNERKANPKSPDAWGKLGAALANTQATLAAVKDAPAPTLTDAQVAGLAEQVVPVLVPALLTAMGHSLDGTK